MWQGNGIRAAGFWLGIFLVPACTVAPVRADLLDRPFENWQAHRFRGIVQQRTDFTCGAAALAIISQRYYGKQIPEQAFTDAIRKTYSDKEWKEREEDGFSLLDLKHAAERNGFSAEGLKLTPKELFALKGPVVIHLDKGFIRHFAVFKGIKGDRAFVADPILGHSRMPLYRFLHEWTGYALAIWIDKSPLPAQNELAVPTGANADELDAVRGALYERPPTSVFSPLNQ